MLKQTRIVMSPASRELLRKASSGLSGVDWERIPMDEKKEYTARQDAVIESLMLTEPESFTRRAIAHAADTRARRMARTNAHVKANVQETL